MNLEELFSSSAYLPLFVQAPAPFNPAMVFGAGPVTDTLPLFTVSNINASLNLYTEGALSAVNSLKLFVQGSGFPAYSSLPLVCYNDTIEGTLPLFVIGDGVTPDATPINNTLLLYIQCGFGASLPLYSHGGPQPSDNDTLDLYTLGHIVTTGTLPLSVPNIDDTINNSLNLYVHGF